MITKLSNTDRKVQALYIIDGAKVTLCKPAKPRRSERTWPGTKYSTARLGSKDLLLTK